MTQDILLPPATRSTPGPVVSDARRSVADSGAGAKPQVPGGDPERPGAPDLDTVALKVAGKMFGKQDVSVTAFRHEESGRTVIRVADRATGRTIVQYPPEDLLRVYAAFADPSGSGAQLLDLDV